MRRLFVPALLMSSACAAPVPVRVASPAPASARRDPSPPPPTRAPAVTVIERPAGPPPPAAAQPLEVVRRLELRSTAYCLRGSMRTGVRTRDGMAATDPSVIPLGSVIRVSHRDGRPIGIFVAMDTGGAIRGNRIDLYMDSCREALDWGYTQVIAEVIAIGWSR